MMTFRKWTFLALAEGILCLLALLLPASEPAAAVFLRYSAQRLALILVVLGIMAAILALKHQVNRQSPILEKILTRWQAHLKPERNIQLAFLLLCSGLLACLYLLIAWSAIDPLYQGILRKIGPILAWVSLIGVQTILLVVAWAQDLNREKQIIPVEGATAFIREIGQEIFALVVLIGTQWIFIPHRFWDFRPLILKYSPLIMFGLITLSRLLAAAFGKFSKHLAGKMALIIVLLIGFTITGVAFFNAAEQHAQTINSELLADQSAYVKYTQKVHESGFRYTGNRNQMPLYLYLQALFFDPANDRTEAFSAGKRLNIVLTILLLAGAGLVFRKYLSAHEAVILVFVMAFSAFIFKAPYFTSENLYYFLSFLGFVLMCRMLIQPGWRLALAAGVILGLGHLTKASIIPGLLIFIGVYAAKMVFERFENWKNRSIQLIVLVAVFMLTLLPYGLESKQLYGSFFYNVNYIVMWYDSWDQAIAQADHSGGDPAWHQIPPEETPGLVKYIKEHSAAQIRERLLYGLQRQAENIRYQFNFFNYPAFFSLAVLLILITNFQAGRQLIQENFFLIGFAALYLAGYFTSFVWYSVIASLWRFIYGLLLPFMFGLFVSISHLSGKENKHLSHLIYVTVSMMLILDIWYVLEIGLFLKNFAS